MKVAVRYPDDIERAVFLSNGLARVSTDGIKRFDVEKMIDGIRVTLTKLWSDALISDVVKRSLEVVRRRLDETGLIEPSITREGTDGILVQMPSVADPTQIRQLLGTTAKMTFHWEANNRSAESTVTMAYANSDRLYKLEQHVAMEGKHIRDAQLGFSQQSNAPVVTFKLGAEGTRQFGTMKQDNIGRVLAVILDNNVITAPVIRGEISGSFTERVSTSIKSWCVTSTITCG